MSLSTGKEMAAGETHGLPEAVATRSRNLTALMVTTGLACLIGAGALLWWREGDRLFTDGLVSALMRCF